MFALETNEEIFDFADRRMVMQCERQLCLAYVGDTKQAE